MNSSDMAKPGNLYNKLANLYLRFGVLGLSAVTSAIAILAVPQMDWSHINVRHWIVTKGFGRGSKFTTYDNNEGLNVLLIAFAVGIIGGLIIFAIKEKQPVDFQKDGCKLRYGSQWRKIVFTASLLLGFTGLDRIMLRCYMLGSMKMFLFVGFLSIFSLAGAFPNDGILLAIASVFFTTIVLWWTVDLLLIHGGTVKYKSDSCRYPLGSGKRKIAFILSLLAGYTGIDRLTMTRPGYFPIKLIISWLSLAFIMFLLEKDMHFLCFLPCLIVALCWWLSDVWTIRKKTSTVTAKYYLR